MLFAAIFGAAGNPPETKEKALLWWERIGGDVSLDSFVGIGTFVRDRHADNPYWASTLTLTPEYEIIEDLRVRLYFALTYEWTRLVTPCHEASGPRAQGAPTRDCSDTDDPNGQRFDLLDLVLSVSHAKIIELGPFTWSGAGKIAFPTSRTSRHANNILSLGAGTAADFDLEPFSVGLSFEFYKHFPTAKAAVLDAIEAENGGSPIGRCASFRETSCVALQGFVANYNLKVELDAGFDFPWVDGLSTSISFAYLYARRFGRAPDALTSPFSNGVNHDDSTIGSWDVSYELFDHYTFSLGIYSWQPARTADGKKIRFPFYDFVSPANNYTTLYTTFTASL